MTIYYVDSVQTGLTGDWVGALSSFWDAGSPAGTLAAGDIVYVSSRHVEADVTATKTLTGPTTDYASVISVTVNTTTPAVGAQIKTTGGAYQLIFINALYVYGVTLQPGTAVIDIRAAATGANSADSLYESCTFKLAHNGSISNGNNWNSWLRLLNCTFDYSSDTSNTAANIAALRGPTEIIGGSLVKPASFNRTGTLFEATSGNMQQIRVVGLDMSVIAATNEITTTTPYGRFEFFGCSFPSGYLSSSTLTTAAITTSQGEIRVIGCGNTHDPRVYFYKNRAGLAEYETTAVRSGGATVEGDSVSWKITTTDKATEHFPFYTDWIYGTVTTTGTKTFDVYIAHNAAGGGTGGDFYDSEIWLELQYLDTSGSPLRTHATDHRSWASSPTEQTDDVASSWGGSPGSNLQKLSVASVSVDESGLYRARVAVGKASATVYVDPKVTVS